MMTHGSLFSGIGGFDLAAEWMGWENVFSVEIDEWCNKVIAKNFPNVKRYRDIKEFDGTIYRGAIDVLSGGFPCQPFSQAGKRKGKSDDRFLWPEYLRIIREIQPAYVVGENVAGLISMEDGETLEGIFTDLEGEGYEVESFIIPACGVGAWHRRDRIWIVAYPMFRRGSRIRQYDRQDLSRKGAKKRNLNENDVSYTNRQGFQAFGEQGGVQKAEGKTRSGTERGCMLGRKWSESWWESEPSVGRVANGISNRMDRIKGLGNSVVPQVVYEIFKAIDLLNDAKHDTHI